MKLFEKVSSVLPYFIVFFASLSLPLDPDLGWHLQYGKYFFRSGEILKTNTFSTMMPDYAWINSSWATDLITYATYAFGGFFGLTLVGAAVVTLTFFFFSKAFFLTTWEETVLFPLILFLEDALNKVSFRGQLLSILFIGILIYILEKYKNTRHNSTRFLFLLPLLFLVWVNVHGQYLFGLAIFFLWIATHCIFLFISQRKKGIVLIAMFFASVAATLVNPFGVGVWQETLHHFGNPSLRYVVEWLPFEEFSMLWWNNIYMGILLAISLVFLFFKKQLWERKELISVVFVLYILTSQVRRYAWPTYYLAMPLLTPLANIIKPDKKTHVLIGILIINTLVLLFLVVDKHPLTQFSSYNWQAYCQKAISCSDSSIKFLINSPYKNKKLLSLYGWGGWIIFRYPEIKPTIDGRMHLWKDANGYNAFTDYYGYEQGWKSVDKSSYDVVYMPPSKPIYKTMQKLAASGKWKNVYKDRVAAIFVRK